MSGLMMYRIVKTICILTNLYIFSATVYECSLYPSHKSRKRGTKKHRI